MKKFRVALIALLALSAAASAQVIYNQFSPGGALGGTGTSQTVNLAAGGSFILNQLPPSAGGLGTNCTATNGFIPIGNGTNFTCAALTAGTGATVTNGAGSVTIAFSGAPVVATVTGSDTRINTTAPSNDAFLTFTSLASGTYQVTCFLAFSDTGGTPGANVQWTTTTNGAFINGSSISPAGSGTAFQSNSQTTFTTNLTYIQSFSGAATFTMWVQSIFSNTGSGVQTLGWSQNSLDAVNTVTLLQGSSCQLTKII